MGQHCTKDDANDDASKKERNPKRKNKSDSDRKPSITKYSSVVDATNDANEDIEATEGDGWKASSATQIGIIGLAHRSMPRPLLVPKTILSKDFREYSTSSFGGRDQAFLTVASTQTLTVDGKEVGSGFLCAGEGLDINYINFATGHIIQRWAKAHSKDINRLTRPVADDRGIFYSASRDNTIKGWIVGEQGCSTTFEGHTLNVTAVDAHPQGRRVASGSRDNTVRLWDSETSQCIANQDVKLNIVHFVKWVPSIHTIAQGGEDLTVRLWDTRAERDSLTLTNTLANFDYHPICCDLVTEQEAPGRERILYTGHNGFNGAGSMITEWDLTAGKALRHYKGHSMTVRAVRRLRTGPLAGYLVSVDDDNTLKLWRGGQACEALLGEVEKPVASVSIPEGRPSGIDESPDGKLLISLRSGSVLVLSTPTLETFGERFRYLGSPQLD